MGSGNDEGMRERNARKKKKKKRGETERKSFSHSKQTNLKYCIIKRVVPAFMTAKDDVGMSRRKRNFFLPKHSYPHFFSFVKELLRFKKKIEQ